MESSHHQDFVVGGPAGKGFATLSGVGRAQMDLEYRK